MKENRSKLKFAAGIAIVFFVGVLAGVLGAGIYFEARIEKMFFHGPPTGDMILNRLEKELDLSASQLKEIRPIILDMQKRSFALKRNISPQIKTILEETRVRIREKLNDEQKRKFERINEKFKKRFRKGRPFPPPPPFLNERR